MWPIEAGHAWYTSPYTGLFVQAGPAHGEPYDPDAALWAGVVPFPGPEAEPAATGGCGWEPAAAEAACVGEAVERWQGWPLPCDGALEASCRDWPVDEPCIGPGRWVLYHPEQYALPGFPYQPLTAATVCRWVAFRQAFTGLPCWVPEDLAYLMLPPGRQAQLCSLVSTGMGSGRWGQPVLLRSLQEVIERDAVTGAAWGRYPLEEQDAGRVLGGLGHERAARVIRPNLTYRCYRVGTPFSAHVTVVTLEGEDRSGYCFSVGSACRESRSASWEKAVLEAIQGRHFVRYLKERLREEGRGVDVPASFGEHAAYYSLFPERLSSSVLGRVVSAAGDPEAELVEDVAALAERLGPERPVLFRNLTPPGIAMEQRGWVVLRVLVPGLQPLHGHHALPFLGGPLWAPRGWQDWLSMPPHPFP